MERIKIFYSLKLLRNVDYNDVVRFPDRNDILSKVRSKLRCRPNSDSQQSPQSDAIGKTAPRKYRLGPEFVAGNNSLIRRKRSTKPQKMQATLWP